MLVLNHTAALNLAAHKQIAVHKPPTRKDAVHKVVANKALLKKAGVRKEAVSKAAACKIAANKVAVDKIHASKMAAGTVCLIETAPMIRITTTWINSTKRHECV